MTESRSPERRKQDHIPPCSILKTHVDLEKALLVELNEIKKSLADMKDLLQIFNNTRGFVTVLKWLGGIVIGLGALWLAITTLLQAFKFKA